MKDMWCGPMTLPDGRIIAGAAAREKRIAAAGGMEEILTDVFRRANTLATQTTSKASNDSNRNEKRTRKKKTKSH